jgi:hypothetical protein
VLHDMGLHWAEDPVGQLVQCRHALRPDGMMMATLFGGQTLRELRVALAEAEAAVTGGLSPRVAPMVADVPAELAAATRRGDRLLFEGAQGALLDIDHGTYPYVTSSNCIAGAAAAGAGVGPQMLDYVLGIAKAYTTRVGSGPFPTELFDETGLRLATVGKEFGSVTGRPRRCGWFDAVAMRRSIQLNGVSGLCVTKLDVLDGLPSVKICTGYLCGDEPVDLLPFGAEDVATCVPVYEEMPGWSTTTFGARSWDVLPPEAQRRMMRWGANPPQRRAAETMSEERVLLATLANHPGIFPDVGELLAEGIGAAAEAAWAGMERSVEPPSWASACPNAATTDRQSKQ